LPLAHAPSAAAVPSVRFQNWYDASRSSSSRGKALGTGVSSSPDASSSPMAARNWFWCIVSRAMRKRSMSRTPASSLSW
jgi:hypothetical protein